MSTLLVLFGVLACLPSSAPVGAASPAPAPDPVAGRTLAVICADDGLAMIRFPYSTLQGEFAKVCCGPGGLPADDGRCELDWPFSDVPECAAYDELRNRIYAHYGYPFKDERWVKAYGSQAWYQRREDFQPSWLSPVAKANIDLLVKYKAEKVGCQ